MSCICRTDKKTGQTWTNTACSDHGVQSSSKDPLTVSERHEQERK